MDSVPDVMAAVRNADCVVIVTNHSSYDYVDMLQEARLMVDTRNAAGTPLGCRLHPKVVRL